MTVNVSVAVVPSSSRYDASRVNSSRAVRDVHHLAARRLRECAE